MAKRAPISRANRWCSSRGHRSCSPTATSFGTGCGEDLGAHVGRAHHQADDVVDALAPRQRESFANERQPTGRHLVQVVADAPQHEGRPHSRCGDRAERADSLDAAERQAGLGRGAQQREAREAVGAFEQGELGERAGEAVSEHVGAAGAIVEEGQQVVEEEPFVVAGARRVEVPRTGIGRLVLAGEVVGLDPESRCGEQRQHEYEVFLRAGRAGDQDDTRAVDRPECDARETPARSVEPAALGTRRQAPPIEVGQGFVERAGIVDHDPIDRCDRAGRFGSLGSTPECAEDPVECRHDLTIPPPRPLPANTGRAPSGCV